MRYNSALFGVHYRFCQHDITDKDEIDIILNCLNSQNRGEDPEKYRIKSIFMSAANRSAAWSYKAAALIFFTIPQSQILYGRRRQK